MRVYLIVDEDLGATVNKKEQTVKVRVGKDFAENLFKGKEVDFVLPIRMR